MSEHTHKMQPYRISLPSKENRAYLFSYCTTDDCFVHDVEELDALEV